MNDVIALDGITLDIPKGQFVVVLGRNGSGKSTLARNMNALLIPDAGAIYISGLDTRIESNVWEIRKKTGMVFQNPDNQIVGTTVEEDVAFGVENIGVKTAEIRVRVDEAVNEVGMSEYMNSAPHLLSGGQKQRVAIAGILAMKPECIVLDEATAMLDPVGRDEVLSVVRRLNKEENITIIHITHHMNEAIKADRVIVVDGGKVILDGTPKEVFKNVDILKSVGLSVPQVTEVFHKLIAKGIVLPTDIISVEEAHKVLIGLLSNTNSH
ncbi:MAG TPA: energy-coupling factor transporter ATPase [Clostridia bacterium]|nr:energy-coupling factor transporter ATPase [Clostridia bacterium]